MKIENFSDQEFKEHKKQSEKDLTSFFGLLNAEKSQVEKDNNELNVEIKEPQLKQTEQSESFETQETVETFESKQIEQEKQTEEVLIEAEEIEPGNIENDVEAIGTNVAKDIEVEPENITNHEDLIESKEAMQNDSEPDTKLVNESNNTAEEKVESQPEQIIKKSSQPEQSKNYQAQSDAEKIFTLSESQIENLIINAINKKESIDETKKVVPVKQPKPKQITESKAATDPKKKQVIFATLVSICFVISVVVLGVTYKDEIIKIIKSDTNESIYTPDIVDTEPPIFELYQNEISIERSKLTDFDCSKYIDRNSFSDNVDDYGKLMIAFTCPDMSRIGDNTKSFAITYVLSDSSGNQSKKNLVVNIID